MARAILRSLCVAALALAAAGCSMFREGEEVSREAVLHGDPGRSAVEAINQATPGRAYAEPMPNEMAPALETRSVLYALHLASYRSQASAEAGWRIIAAEAAGALDGLHPRVETVNLGPERGVYLRLKAGPLDSAEDAAARCARLVDAGHYCQAIDFEGRDLSG